MSDDAFEELACNFISDGIICLNYPGSPRAITTDYCVMCQNTGLKPIPMTELER
jgi:hypothetical protein